MDDRSLSVRFWSGFAAGVAASAAVLHALFAWLVAPTWKASLADLGGRIPIVTTVALSAPWAWGVPAAVVLASVAAGALALRERTRLAAFTVIALAAVAAGAFTYWASYAPLWQLAGNIKAD